MNASVACPQKTRSKLHRIVFERNQTSLRRKSHSLSFIFCWKYKSHKIKNAHHIIIGEGCIWEEISLMNACWVIQSVFYQVLLQVKGLIQIIVKFRADIYHEPNIHLSGTKYRTQERMWNNALKRTNWKFIFLWRVINWDVLQAAKAHFRYTIWCMISEKCIARWTFFCRGTRVHQKSQQGI